MNALLPLPAEPFQVNSPEQALQQCGGRLHCLWRPRGAAPSRRRVLGSPATNAEGHQEWVKHLSCKLHAKGSILLGSFLTCLLPGACTRKREKPLCRMARSVTSSSSASDGNANTCTCIHWLWYTQAPSAAVRSQRGRFGTSVSALHLLL